MTGNKASFGKRLGIYGALLLLILIIGIFLRFYHIDKESIWADEGFTICTATHVMESLRSYDSLIKNYVIECNPPLYFIVMHYWVKIFGKSEYSLRVPSALAGILSLYVVFLLGKTLYEEKTGVIAALLLMISTYNVINVSQEARPYSLMNLFTLLSFYYLYRSSEEARLRDNLLHVLFSIALIYTHYYGFFVILAQDIYVVLTLIFFRQQSAPQQWKGWLAGQVLILLAYAPWIGFLLHQVSAPKESRWLQIPAIQAVPYNVLIFANRSIPLLVLGCILAALSLHIVRKQKSGLEESESDKESGHIRWRDTLRQNRQSILLILWLTGVLIVPYLFSLVFFPLYGLKYVVPASLAFYLLMARGISAIPSKYITAVILIVILALSIPAIIPFYRYPHKEQWREAVSSIEQAAEPGDLVVICSGVSLNHCYRYYAKRTDLDVKPFPVRSMNIYTNYTFINTSDAAELRQTVNDHEYVWLVLSPQHQDPENLIKRTLQMNYRVLAVRKFYEIQVILLGNRKLLRNRKPLQKNPSPGKGSVP